MIRSFLPLVALTSTQAMAADMTLPSLSPRAQVMQTVGVAEVTVNYSSPGKRDRTIWGELVPYDELWRTGANRATTIESSHAFTIGGQDVDAGKYALFTIPGESEWTVIVNSNPNQGGTGSYDEALDVARFTVTPADAGTRERLTFLFSDTSADATHLDLEWDGVRVTLPIGFATDDLVASSVSDYRTSAADELADAARHMDRSGDAASALTLIDASLAMERSWYNVWIKASLLHDAEEHRDAKALATEALELGEAADGGFFWEDRVRAAVDEWPRR